MPLQQLSTFWQLCFTYSPPFLFKEYFKGKSQVLNRCTCSTWVCVCKEDPSGLVVKNLPTVQETQEMGSIPGSGRSSGGGNGNPLQYSHLGNPMVRGAWQLQFMGLQRVGGDWTHIHTWNSWVCNTLTEKDFIFNLTLQR